MLKITSVYPQATGVLLDFKNYVVKQAKTNLTKGKKNATGSLYKSISGYIDKKMNRGANGRFSGGSTPPSLVFKMNSYGKFIDEGVQGTKSNYVKNRLSPYKFGRNGNKGSIPPNALTKWLKARGINEKAKFAIAKSIYQKGIERTEFFSKPFNKRLKITLKKYHIAAANDIAKNIANQIKKI